MNNLELYKTFYYVAKAGSITAAAQQLSLTQPAVSQSMKQLEAQLNVSLFQRTAKGIRLKVMITSTLLLLLLLM